MCPIQSSFLENDDPNMLSSLQTRTFPEPAAKSSQQSHGGSSSSEVAEKPPKVDFMRFVMKLIKEGGLAKYIAKGSYPAPMHEPFSEHHRRAQMAEFFGVLDQAGKEPKGSQLRLLHVTAFIIASWSEARLYQMEFKPVKAVPHETFEIADPDRGYKFLAEEVYQDKTKGVCISFWKAWGRGWGLEFINEPQPLKFSFGSSGPCLDYDAGLHAEICFRDGEKYAASLPPGTVTHLTSAPQVWSFSGSAIVKNTSSGMTCEADLNEPGFLSKEGKHRVKGHLIVNGKPEKNWKLHGHWDKQLIASWTGENAQKKDVLLWSAPSGARNRFGFNQFAAQLNNLTPELCRILPPTDSRLRGETRAIEAGDYAKAEQEIKRLSEWQAQVTPDESKAPLWFEPRTPDSSSKLKYRYKGGYWEARAAKLQGTADAWKNCPSIFGTASDQPQV